MKSFLIFILIAASTVCSTLHAQSGDSTRLGYRPISLFVEVFSGPVLYSINYQKVLLTRKNTAFSYRLSCSFLPDYQSIGGYAGLLWGKRRKALEFMLGSGLYRMRGAAANIFVDGSVNDNLFLNPQIGFRGERSKGKLLVRATFSPWVLLGQEPNRIRLSPGFGFSIGKTL